MDDNPSAPSFVHLKEETQQAQIKISKHEKICLFLTNVFEGKIGQWICIMTLILGMISFILGLAFLNGSFISTYLVHKQFSIIVIFLIGLPHILLLIFHGFMEYVLMLHRQTLRDNYLNDISTNETAVSVYVLGLWELFPSFLTFILSFSEHHTSLYTIINGCIIGFVFVRIVAELLLYPCYLICVVEWRKTNQQVCDMESQTTKANNDQ